MAERIETIVIGAGQAGLAASYCLGQLGREHLVLEQAAGPGSAWRARWDSFTLVTPNWSIRLPGAEYQGEAPDGFLARDEIVAYLARYAEQSRRPVRYQTRVTAVEPLSGGKSYRVTADGAEWEAANVVVAAGLFQHPKIPAFSARLPAGLTQIHSGAYRNPGALPPGAVLIVGSGQSGCQIAEELYQNGRRVFLSVGSAGRAPRRYRGKDLFKWMELVGYLDRTPDKLASPAARFAGNPHVSGRDGGRSLNLHQFARDGVTLLGRLQDVQHNDVYLAPDLRDNLAKADKFEADLIKQVDAYIETNGLDAPAEELPQLKDGYTAEMVSRLNLESAGVTSVIWAGGYTFDFSWVRGAPLDEFGYPRQQRGVTSLPGLYFLGLNWLYKQKSALLVGVGEDAAHVAQHLDRKVTNGE